MSPAKPPPRKAAAGPPLQVVVVAVGADEYALPIDRVQEVVHYTRPRPLPHTDPHVRGVIDLRGRVIPVVSARASFGLSDSDLPDDAKIAVLQLGDAPVGLIVDDVVEVLSVDSAIAVPPPHRAGVAAVETVESVMRLPDRLLAVLNVDALLDPARQAIAVSLEAFAPPPRDELVVVEPDPEPVHEVEPQPQPETEPEPEPTPEPEPATEKTSLNATGIDSSDITSVRAVFAMMEEHEQQALDLFSARLGDVDPGLRLRLGLDDAAQRRRFMAALRLSVRGLDQLDELLPALSALGVGVDTRAISSADCRTAVDAFLWTLQRGLGSRFDAASRRACGASAWALLGMLARQRP